MCYPTRNSTVKSEFKSVQPNSRYTLKTQPIQYIITKTGNGQHHHRWEVVHQFNVLSDEEFNGEIRIQIGPTELEIYTQNTTNTIHYHKKPEMDNIITDGK